MRGILVILVIDAVCASVIDFCSTEFDIDPTAFQDLLNSVNGNNVIHAVSILGHHSTGKSHFLNDLFDTHFPEKTDSNEPETQGLLAELCGSTLVIDSEGYGDFQKDVTLGVTYGTYLLGVCDVVIYLLPFLNSANDQSSGLHTLVLSLCLHWVRFQKKSKVVIFVPFDPTQAVNNRLVEARAQEMMIKMFTAFKGRPADSTTGQPVDLMDIADVRYFAEAYSHKWPPGSVTTVGMKKAILDICATRTPEEIVKALKSHQRVKLDGSLFVHCTGSNITNTYTEVSEFDRFMTAFDDARDAVGEPPLDPINLQKWISAMELVIQESNKTLSLCTMATSQLKCYGYLQDRRVEFIANLVDHFAKHDLNPCEFNVALDMLSQYKNYKDQYVGNLKATTALAIANADFEIMLARKVRLSADQKAQMETILSKKVLDRFNEEYGDPPNDHHIIADRYFKAKKAVAELIAEWTEGLTHYGIDVETLDASLKERMLAINTRRKSALKESCLLSPLSFYLVLALIFAFLPYSGISMYFSIGYWTLNAVFWLVAYNGGFGKLWSNIKKPLLAKLV